MKRMVKVLSWVLAVAMVTIIAPISAKADDNYKNVEVTEEHYYPNENEKLEKLDESKIRYNKKGIIIQRESIGYDHDYYNGEPGKLRKYSEQKTTYTDRGEMKSDVSIRYDLYNKNSKPQKQVIKYPYLKSSKGNKAIYSDGSYSISSEKTKGTIIIKKYTVKGILESTTTQITNGKNFKSTTKNGNVILQEIERKDGAFSQKSYYDSGKLSEEFDTDKNGNVVFQADYNEDGTCWFERACEYENNKIEKESRSIKSYDSEGKAISETNVETIYSYMNGKIISSISEEVSRNSATEWSESGIRKTKTESIYYTSRKSQGRVKTTTKYTDISDQYVRGGETNYTYKFDKKGNVVEQVEKDANTGMVKCKIVYIYKWL